jgi:uncharacterized protein involved in response to NO
MLIDKLSEPGGETQVPALLRSGFRPFFLGAMVFAIISMTLWSAQYSGLLAFSLPGVTAAQWHGHEMLFGYSMAVIAGFLLTAVQNWTGGKSAQGHELLLVIVLWALTRAAALLPSAEMLWPVLVTSTLFYGLLLRALLRPLIVAKNNGQWIIISKLLLLWLLDLTFISSAAGWLDPAFAGQALLLALYTVIGLILLMAQRVVPMFTRNAINQGEGIRNYPFVPRISMVFMLLFAVADLMHWPWLMLISGCVVFLVNALRLYGWHAPELWSKPLVWVLHVALWFIIAGVLLRSVSSFLGFMPSLGLHAMTFGGIGLVTVGMMSRVALGHTGRNVMLPFSSMGVVFGVLVVGALLRSVAPLLSMEYYIELVQAAQVLWIVAFLWMLRLYFKPLTQPRVDGQYG